MVSTFTPNINLEEPARGDDVGTWDTPVNSNTTVLDLGIGAITTISVSAGSVVLSAAQFRSKAITLNSTLLANTTITFPTSFVKSYEIYNVATGSSQFTLTLTTTASGGQAICCPPGEIVDVVNDGANIRFKNLGRIGEYWDYAGSSVPIWVTGCTVPPYLNCNGTTFSSATYPALTTILGSTTLPDSKGRTRMALDQSAGRVSSAVAGFSPNTIGAAGGDQNLQAHSHTNTLTDPGHNHAVSGGTIASQNLVFNYAGAGGQGGNAQSITINSNVTGIVINNATAGSGAGANLQPTYVGGITMIRAG